MFFTRQAAIRGSEHVVYNLLLVQGTLTECSSKNNVILLR